ncbi:MAG: ECF transporter S component [Bacilli bacterium]|nr:ECF transporter S component [Bacilli bacterium]
MFKYSVLQRMTFTAMMFALYVIATRFIMVPVTNYVRLSAGIAILIFSSILLGPISGALVGAGGDLVGALLVPYMGLTINPFMTLSYGLMGATPGFIMLLFRHFKNKNKIYSVLFFSLLLVIFVSLTVYMSISESVTLFEHEFKINLIGRIVAPIIAFIILGLLALFTYFLNQRFKKKREIYPKLPSPYQISFIVVIIEVVFTLFINIFAKMWIMEVPDFSVIFFPSLFLAFIYIPLNTIIVSYLCLLSVKIIKVRE